MQKRGQVSLFIILGIIFLLVFLLLFYLMGDIIPIFIPPVVMPQEISPLKGYVDSCIHDIGTEAVQKMGVQAGYVEIPARISENSDAHIQVIGEIKTPYWHYNGEDISPSLSDMENEISRHVSENLRDCLGDFSQFPEFIIEEKGEPNAHATIAEEEVVIKVNYPLIIKNRQGDMITSWSDFLSSVPVRLRPIYRLAKQIMRAENREMFLEKATIDLMSVSPEVPFTDLVFTCENIKWSRHEIKDEIKGLLYHNLPKIRIENTDYRPFLYSDDIYQDLKKIDLENEGMPENIPEDIYEYNNLFWEIRGENFPDLKAGVRYLKDWEMFLNINPGSGDYLHSNMVKASPDFLSSFCINTYHFTYDIIYPVEIAIRDDKSFAGEGYVFRYAIPVMIRSNEAHREAFGISDTLYYDPKEFCEDVTEEKYTITAINARTKQEINDVSITFGCIRHYCDLGSTEFDGNNYRLTASIPSGCSNGIFYAEKQGFLKAQKQASSRHIKILMEPLKSLDFSVMKVNNDGEKETLSETESAIIRIIPEKGKEIFAVYPSKEMRNIEILENTENYFMEIFLSDQEKIKGGFKADWSLSYEEIKDKNKVIFYAYDLGIHETPEEKLDMIEFINENMNKENLMPELK